MTSGDGLCMTHQRRVILEELRKVKTHPTADEIYEMVRKILPHISLGTVYRNLDILSDCKLIQKLNMSGAQKRFDGNPEYHHHIKCDLCGRVDDISVESLTDIVTTVTDSAGYEVTGYLIEFTGICPDCK